LDAEDRRRRAPAFVEDEALREHHGGTGLVAGDRVSDRLHLQLDGVADAEPAALLREL
jgi:hypothetical protein